MQAYLLGSNQPLRFRLRGPGSIEGASSRYAERIAKLFGNTFGGIMRFYILFFFFYPHVLSLMVGAVLFWGIQLSGALSISVALLCWALYMNVDLFRFVAWTPILIIDGFILRKASKQNQSLSNKEIPNYHNPEVFQTDA
ncbi:MAG: hypothetical protein QNJ55_06110 [Xenococcus sp. MO_188.B8]|nr:hypothetical protein [Xenococcus sp. MO_188.B8]